MNKLKWNDPRVNLPVVESNKESVRCLALIFNNDDSISWTGFCEVRFTPHECWRNSHTSCAVHVLKWVYSEDLKKLIED